MSRSVLDDCGVENKDNAPRREARTGAISKGSQNQAFVNL